MRLLAIALITLVSAQNLSAQDRSVTVQLQSWSEVDFGGGADSHITYGGSLRTEGPVAFGSQALADVFAQLDITSLPGQPDGSAFDIASPNSWGRYAALTLGAQREIGTLSRADQRVYTALEFRWAFATALDKRHDPAQRFTRAFALGITLGERTSRARLFLGYGNHDAAGPRHPERLFLFDGEILLDGQCPVPGTGAVVFVGGSAFLSVGPRAGLPDDVRDGFQLRVQLDVSRIASKVL